MNENYETDVLALLIYNMKQNLAEFKSKWEEPTKQQKLYLSNYEKHLSLREIVLTSRLKANKNTKITIVEFCEDVIKKYKEKEEKLFKPTIQKTKNKNVKKSKSNKQIRQSTSRVCNVKLSWS